MNNSMEKEYYIGLDVGTDSIGWAVTDLDYNISKFKGNAMWGIRLLEESKTAEERRSFRSARRRTQRKKFRLQCLEMLFDKEISQRDVSFFQRMHDSNFYEEDKSVTGKYSLFNDSNYTDKNYHMEYPTIYHLRKELIESTAPHDVRLVFLAISHIVKNRGHFLFSSETLGENTSPEFSEVWNELVAYVYENQDIQLDCESIDDVQNILKDKTLSITRKKEDLSKVFKITKKDEPQYSIVSLLAGATVSSATIFDDEELKQSEASKITFTSGYDDKVATYESVFGDGFELIERLKAVYDWSILADVLKNKQYISFAKVEVYKKHKDDLKVLKEYVRRFVPSKYNLIFNENKKGTNNYLAYSGHSKKTPLESKCKHEDFLDFLKKQLPKDVMSNEYEKMYNEIALGTFLPKMVSKDNSVIPMQINRAELVKILRNAEVYLPFLLEKDLSNKTVSEKILDIFAYRIPYYVGPLNRHSDKHWLERSDEKIYPWNLEEVVDMDKSAENFINNLTSKCTYLKREDVLPKNSFLYSKFSVLNELNNLKLDGQPISLELKQNIYEDLFMRRNKVTAKALKDYLSSHGYRDVEITGIDGDFKSTLKVHRDFEKYALSFQEKDEIVKAITIFGDDRKLLKRRLQNQFAEKLSEDEVKQILKLKYTGWGRLSEKFLSGIQSVCFETGEVNSIINFMWGTNDNLMQVLSSNYGFVETINEENGDMTFTSLKKEVDELYVSPKVKRPIYQTMQIVEEIVKIKGCVPKKIFVEVARGPEEKKERKVSRKTKLVELYKACKKDNLELFEALQNTDESEFRRDALYLYYTQFGRCMYTGKPIAISDIYNRNLYDIDHIYPQSKIKDDSLNNRVLVTKVSNEEKGNVYPIRQEIRNERSAFWRLLLEKGLIEKKKYERLVRSHPLTDDELMSFVSRQLVETRQSTKAIAQLLDKRYGDVSVYVKAGLVSDFRRHYEFTKCREINDLHHAKDAYLNIVVGNVYDTRFTRNKANFISGLQRGEYSLNKMYAFDIEGAWVARGDNKSIEVVKKTMEKNNIRFTRYSYKQKGGLFDQNILKKGNGQVPIKKNTPLEDIEKYGGYNHAASTYFALAKYIDEKGNMIKAFVPVDLYKENEYIDNPVAYVNAWLEVDNAEIVIPCVKYNTLVSVNGFRMHLSSKSNGGKNFVCKPAVQLVLSVENERYVKRISKYLEKCAELRKEKEVTSFDKITSEDNLKIYNAICDKLNNSIFNAKFDKLAKTLSNKVEIFEGLSIYEQCMVIMQILNILHANVRSGDLSEIGESKQSGITTIGNKVVKSKTLSSFKIIHQSITGLYEESIELID